ncbi:unnamed protein product [Phytophthora fragariaefolia]|uniref:Unnamed protein product n=1 Tax=Phytophthora fragariaefolia TaxID=1490495 RepID=A0A9W6Y3E8_9STRA|nr:unnamed protein product [Phytophthora fragariaefolia]
MQDGASVLFEVVKVRGKGMALVCDQEIKPGGFVCQYTGEVISLEAYRCREQVLKGALNGYGMAVGTDEVIDARNVGDVARFANHSCSPNCVVERWEVNGEICCAFYATRHIEVGGEITIGYGRGNTKSKVRKLFSLVGCSCPQFPTSYTDV